MSREIKFRAFGDYPLKMFNVSCITWENGKIISLYDNEGFEYKSTIPLMQFTGLHDKNGKDIYEGDIVKIEEKDTGMFMRPDFFGEIGVIKWIERDSRFVLWIKKDEFEIGYNGHHPYHGDLVLGNIFENPELLEDK